jgi:hypothetical protein
VGEGVPAWTPADATSATLRAWIVFDQDNLTLDGSLINSATDLSGTGNDLAALALDTTRPTFDADGFLGKGCAVFDGVNDALAKAGFSWGGTGYGTIAWFGQTDENVASDAIWGYNGARPFVRTSSNGGLAAQVTTNGTPTVSTTKSSYGPTCHISRWDGSGTDFTVFVDGVSETPALATGSPPADNLRMGLGYDGAATPNRHHKCRVRAFVAYRGALSDDETQLLNAYMRSLAPLPTVGPVELIWAGQSNAMAEGLTLFPRLVQRRNINAARDNTKASGPVREQTPWGPIDDAYLVTSLRSIGIEAMVQLNEERGISGHLLNSAYTGAGFLVGDGSTVDRWIPPSRNSGTGGEAYDRLITLVNDTRTNEPAGTARSRTWFLWCHGETDALNSTGAGDYEDNLSALIDDYIADTGDTDLRIAIVQLPSGYDGGSDPADRATIRAAQAAVVAAKSNAYLIDVDAFALQPDDVHYSQAMAIEIATQLCDLISTDLGVPLPLYDHDAQAYFDRVEGPSGDNQSLEPAVKTAINDFVVGCKADGIWTAIKASCILAGARTLSGALQPLVGTAPTSFNFVSGDYDRKTGLVGDGTTKYLSSNRANNADPQDDNHNAFYVTGAPTAGLRFFMATDAGPTAGANNFLQNTDANLYIRNRSSTYNNTLTSALILGFKGFSRDNSANYTLRDNATTSVITRASETPSASVIQIFDRGTTPPHSPTDARLAFYSIGEDLDLALLDTRVSALMTAIDGAIP